MRFILILIFLAFNFSASRSQDVIVLRKNDAQLNCSIISINDSLLSYRLWESPDTTVHTLKKFEVLSYMMDTHSQKLIQNNSGNASKNADTDLLGEYRFGSLLPGYVIKENNDTLHGFIRIKDAVINQLEVRFFKDIGDSVLFTPVQLKGYGYADVIYEKLPTRHRKEIVNGRKPVDGQLFLHLAVNGPSKLYRFYSLRFRKSTVSSYHQDPPFFLGRLKRHFIITNPAGKKVFSKGGTLKGSVNRIYYMYPKYFIENPLVKAEAGKLPEIVSRFNYWYQKQ